MKKFLFLGALAAMLLGTASCSNEMEPEMTDGTVQFKVELPGAIDSRAIADGTTATKLEVACYDADGNKLAVEPTVKTDFVNREATVTYKLVKGQTYNFAFFAHADGAPYTFTPGTNMAGCKFDVNYTGVCNAENRDAFYAVLKDYAVSATTTTVELHRPFAQLNFGADDLAAAKAAGIIPSQSKVKVSKAASTFSLFSGETSNDVENIEYTLADLPDATTVDGVMTPATLTVEGTDYAWMEMCYFLVPGNEANVDVEMTVKTNKADVVVPVASVPVKKNHRTNIVGSLFTQDANFRVIIDQEFDTPDYNIGLLSDPAAIAEAIQTPGAEVNVAPGMQLELDLRTIAEGVTINGNGSKLILNQTNNKVNANNVTINGFTIDNTQTGNTAITVNASSFTLKNCDFKTSASGHNYGIWLTDMSEDGIYNFDGVVFDAEPQNRNLVIECKGTVNISNSILKNGIYTLSTVSVNGDCDINATNTQFIGWTSYNTGRNHTYNFENCYFGKLNYGYFRPYGEGGTNVVNMNKCTFSDDYEGISPIDGINIYITNSAFESGAQITNSLIDPDKAYSLFADGNVYVDGVKIYDGATEHNE